MKKQHPFCQAFATHQAPDLIVCQGGKVHKLVAVSTRIDRLSKGLRILQCRLCVAQEEIDSLVENLKTKWKVQKIAPGHCTGEPAFARLQKAFGEKYVYAGLGTRVEVE